MLVLLMVLLLLLHDLRKKKKTRDISFSEILHHILTSQLNCNSDK